MASSVSATRRIASNKWYKTYEVRRSTVDRKHVKGMGTSLMFTSFIYTHLILIKNLFI